MGATPPAFGRTRTPPALATLPSSRLMTPLHAEPLEAALASQRRRISTPLTSARAAGRASNAFVGSGSGSQSTLWWERVPTQPGAMGAKGGLDARMPRSTGSLAPRHVFNRDAEERRASSWRGPQWNSCSYSYFDSTLHTGRPRQADRSLSAPWGVMSSTPLNTPTRLKHAAPPVASVPLPQVPPWVARHGIPQLPYNPDVQVVLGSKSADYYTAAVDGGASFPATYERMRAMLRSQDSMNAR